MHAILTFFLVIFGIIIVLILLAYSLLKGLLSGFVKGAKQPSTSANTGNQRQSAPPFSEREKGHNPHKLNKEDAETVSFEEIKE